MELIDQVKELSDEALTVHYRNASKNLARLQADPRNSDNFLVKHVDSLLKIYQQVADARGIEFLPEHLSR